MEELLLECKNCNMKFDTKEQLHNHSTRFCVDSEYADLSKLHKIIEESKQTEVPYEIGNPLSLSEVKSYIRGVDSKKLEGVGKMDLNALRNQIQQQEGEFTGAIAQYTKNREKEVREEVRKMQTNKKQARSDQRQEERFRLELLKDLQGKRDREIRARSDKEQINELEKKQIKQDRKAELQRLAQDRESLRIDEINYIRDLEAIKYGSASINELYERKKDIETERNRILNELKKYKKNNFRKNAPARAAGYQMMNKNNLQISKSIPELNKDSAIDISPNNKDIPESVIAMNDQWKKDYTKLEELKRRHEADKRNLRPLQDSDFKIPTYKPPIPQKKPSPPPPNDPPPSTTQTYTPMPPMWYPPFPYYMPPPFHQFPPFQNPPAEREEDKTLKKEIKKMKKKLKGGKGNNDFYANMQQALALLESKLEDTEQDQEKAPPPPPEDLAPEEKALKNIQRQEQNELQLLSQIPKNSELYVERMAHYKEMSQVRMRMEAMLQELTMQRMRKNFEREMKLEEKRIMNEQWIEDQKRALISSKLQPNDLVEKPSSSQHTGFFIIWDFALGLPLKYSQSQLAFAIYEYGKPMIEPKLVSPTEINESSQAIFFARDNIKMESNKSEALVIVEVQCLNEDGGIFTVGWTAMDIYNDHRQFNEGLWKLPLLKPPTDVMILKRDVRKETTVNNLFIYIRMALADSSSNILRLKMNPFENEGDYMIPYIHTPQTPISNRQSAKVQYSNSGSKGINVLLSTLRSYKGYSDIKMRISLRLAEDILRDYRGNECIWTSEPISTSVRRVPGTNVKDPSRATNSALSIGQSCNFFNDFIRVVHETSEQVYLIVEILEKSLSGTYETAAWSIIQLTEPGLSNILSGSFDLNIYRGSVTFPNIELEGLDRMEGMLQIVIRDTDIPSRATRQNEDVHLKEAFVENLAPQVNYENFDNSGFDFYVDSGRFFPDNSSCLKIIVRSFNKNMDKPTPPLGGLAILDSSIHFPVFEFRSEHRDAQYDPTMFFMITLITVDTSNNEVRIVGYSVINVFNDKYTKEFVTSPDETEFVLNEGCFQIPIYCQEPFRKNPFGLNSFKNLERIPCSSLLVRIVAAPRAEDGRVLSIDDVIEQDWVKMGIVVPPPKYDGGPYNTSAIIPSHVERQLYKIRLARPNTTIREATAAVQRRRGLIVSSDDEEMMNWIDDTLQISSRSQIIDLMYFAKYSTQLGFKISIDAVHNTPTNNPYGVAFCLNPPGSYYLESGSQDIKVTKHLDWESPVKTVKFKDGFQEFKGISADRSIHLVLEVLGYGKKGISPVGWTILPVFLDENYVNSGAFQLPLLKGGVASSLLPDLVNGDPWQFLLRNIGKGFQFLDTTSILVRLLDVQRDNHFEVPLDLNRINYSYIPDNLQNKLVYNSASEVKNSKQKKLSSVIPKGQTTETYGQTVYKAFEELLFTRKK